MPLPPRRQTASLMDTYLCDETELSCSSSSCNGSVVSSGSVTSEDVVREYIRMKQQYDAPVRSGSGRSKVTVSSRSTSACTTVLLPCEGVFRSGYFSSDFSARSKSSSSAILPPRSFRKAKDQEVTPGPGSYTPVYSVLSRPSPFS
eukprot:TRINITY_DN22108_c0_g1_i1.p1 TRINITY_DN22108_c0_g1~~TRINITY_DN22108_c0_g1_i1.p1  ORF type:complete len:146 (+),score=31.80 TRINITY_DN22108_c0_g1_i1:53-490(+)